MSVRGQHWTREEVAACVRSYLDMLRDELSGIPFVKRDVVRLLEAALPSRTKGAIEFKFGNVSAVLIEMGQPYVEGYKPYGNYQRLLVQEVALQLTARAELATLALDRASAPVEDAESPALDTIEVTEPPVRNKPVQALREEDRPVRPPRFVDWGEVESRNRSLGAAGERLVVEYERHRLRCLGADRVASQVEHVSQTKGDGLGYDVLSFDEDGTERLIEVKTTRLGADSPFFVSSNELRVAHAREDVYHLYRVYTFPKRPRLFTLHGRLEDHVALRPVTYRADPARSA